MPLTKKIKPPAWSEGMSYMGEPYWFFFATPTVSRWGFLLDVAESSNGVFDYVIEAGAFAEIPITPGFPTLKEAKAAGLTSALAQVDSALVNLSEVRAMLKVSLEELYSGGDQ